MNFLKIDRYLIDYFWGQTMIKSTKKVKSLEIK